MVRRRDSLPNLFMVKEMINYEVNQIATTKKYRYLNFSPDFGKGFSTKMSSSLHACPYTRCSKKKYFQNILAIIIYLYVFRLVCTFICLVNDL